MESSGKQYADNVASYLVSNFGVRGLSVYREMKIGKSSLGKTRFVDVLVVDTAQNIAATIECKFQTVAGTVDEKIPYALEEVQAMPIPSLLVYGGEGFSLGVVSRLKASKSAAHWSPHCTGELDDWIAVTFRWWDLIVKDSEPVKFKLI